MPFASDKQRRYLYSQKPDVARKFAAHMQQGGDIMPQPRMSLFEMIEEYRASLPQGRGTAPQAPLPMAPEINYGDPMTHPGDPMGQDQVPAWLTEGEFVVNAEAMSDPVNAQVVNDINTQGQIMQDEGLGFGMNRGGYVKYMQQGGEVPSDVMEALGVVTSEVATFAGVDFTDENLEKIESIIEHSWMNDETPASAASMIANTFDLDFTDHVLEGLEEILQRGDEAWDDWQTLPQHERDEYGSFSEFHSGIYSKSTYYQEGGLVQGLQDFASSPAGAAAGQRLALIGAGDLAGAANVKAPVEEEEELDQSITQQMTQMLIDANPHLT